MSSHLPSLRTVVCVCALGIIYIWNVVTRTLAGYMVCRSVTVGLLFLWDYRKCQAMGRLLHADLCAMPFGAYIFISSMFHEPNSKVYIRKELVCSYANNFLAAYIHNI